MTSGPPARRFIAAAPWSEGTIGRRRLLARLLLHRLLDGGTRRDAGLEDLQVGKLGKVELHVRGPGGDGEEIGVRGGELVAEEVVAAGEALVEQLVALAQRRLAILDRLGGRGGVEERTVGLVDLGSDEAQHLLLAIALEAAGFRHQPRLRLLVAEVLHDRRAFGEHFAGRDLQRRHVTLGVDLPEVAVGARGLGLGVDPLQLEREARLECHDVGGERAGARGVVELHWGVPLWCGVGWSAQVTKGNLPLYSTYAIVSVEMRSPGGN